MAVEPSEQSPRRSRWVVGADDRRLEGRSDPAPGPPDGPTAAGEPLTRRPLGDRRHAQLGG